MISNEGVAARGDEPESRSPLTRVLVGLVRAYQFVVSPWFAPRCKYYPSCSAYAVTALRVHGPWRGLGLAGWRLLRCNPWSLGGVDHVPPRSGTPPPDDVVAHHRVPSDAAASVPAQS
jgi:putative membrane protein insertion efficiency factor